MDYVLSEKRRKVVEAIDRFGVITSVQLERYLKDLGVMTIYRARAQGEELGFVETKAFGRRKVLCITKKGSNFIGRIGSAASAGYSTLQHDLTVNDVIFSLLERYAAQGKDFGFKTERELVQELLLSMSVEQTRKPNALRHVAQEVPDFILVNSERRFAFEVELSRKTSARIQKKMNQYKKSLQNGLYDRVFYICKEDAIKKHIQAFASSVGVNISFIMLDDLITGED
ncbi:hypothetical protein K1I48_23330 [Bacillus licheniformis]|uniref:hypothetical protein n=1 Tax=Bacillus licheniformis TaxID=1402 RepID=UPI001C63CF75|nr:hypothetical protein [Bacillus licheniformis]MBW7636356.1 hypothetical protein [Bacillus licheniformis]